MTPTRAGARPARRILHPSPTAEIKPEVKTETKTVITLAELPDERLLAELRRRGYSGELNHTKVIAV